MENYRRQFLGAAAIGALAMPSLGLAQHAPSGSRSPTLLTVGGLIGNGNRGALDPAMDRMLVRQNISFARARVFDFASLVAMPAVTIQPTLEYDGKPHTLKGPLLTDVMKACAVTITPQTLFKLYAIDGYTAQLSAADATHYRVIVATHLDGRPLALGGLGPLWVVYDADRFADTAARPLSARFASSPWATYYIDVNDDCGCAPGMDKKTS